MDKNKLIAIIGVSENPRKFGYKIFTDLISAGLKVVAVGIRGGVIAEKTIYASLKELPDKPDIVLTVVPPEVTNKTVDEIISLGIKEVWMQPGSVSQEAVKKAKLAGVKVTDHGCFMVACGIW